MSHKGVLTIQLDRIAGNWRRLSAEVGAQCRTAAVVKADAYGLGADRVAPVLEAAGCGLFFVATLEEALALRRVIAADIAVLNGLVPGASSTYAQQRLLPVLNDGAQAGEWAAAIGRGARAILQLDTGMSRLGLPPEALAALALERLDLALVMSHLACADEPEHPLNARQHGRFTAMLARFPGIPASLAASSGIFLGSRFHFDLVRPGAALYGVNPVPNAASPVATVIRLEGRIIQVREIDSGEAVGYGASFVASRRSRVATVAVGYADGYLRAAGNQSITYIGEHSVPVIGRVSMDLLTLDVTEIPRDMCRPGDLVELLGERYGVDALGRDSGTIGYEILTSLGSRYERVHAGDLA